MTFTYDASLSSDLAKVRFRIGDTESGDPLLSDEEIGAVLSSEGTVLKAALSACRSISARWARKADASIGAVKESLSQVSVRYSQLAGEILSEIDSAAEAGVSGVAVLTGMSLSDNAAARADEDRYPEAAYLDRDSNAGVGASSDDLA